MTDLGGKFSSFESQIATQHTAIANKLDAILAAMGIPPPTATVTLADIATLLNAINNNLIGIAIANGSYHTSVMNYLADLSIGLGETNFALNQISINTDLLINNGAANAQLLIATLLKTACPCDPELPMLPPPLSVIPLDASDIERCQRIQYFLDVFRNWLVEIAAWNFLHGSISSYELSQLLALKLADLSITTGELASGIPSGIASAIVAKITQATQNVGVGQVQIGLNAVVTEYNVSQFRDAMYSSLTPAQGKSAFDTIVIAVGGVSWMTELITLMFYSSWANDMFSDVPIVDASGFDGTLCAPGEVTECETYPLIWTDRGDFFRWDLHLDALYEGWTVEAIPPYEVLRMYGTTVVLITDTPHTLTAGDLNATTGDYFLSSELIGGDVKVCPPVL